MDEYIEKNKAIKELYEVYDYEFPTASGGFDEYARMMVNELQVLYRHHKRL